MRSSSRAYPPCPEGADAAEVALAATRALVRAVDPIEVRDVVGTAVGDLGGALVPARLEPVGALELDVSLGVGEPVLVAVDPLSVAALHLRAALPGLVEDARLVLQRLPAQAVAAGGDDVPSDALERYLPVVAAGDAALAVALVRGWVADGVDPGALAQTVLAPAQREAGERWYRDEWSVADEHAATAVTDACLAVLPVGVDGPSVLLAAPEGEWHALPGRLAAAAARGTRTRSLGPGLPAEHLRRHLEATRPAALALSCTMATNLLAAARSTAAAHSAGVPVVAGGRAFGLDARRAERLGARWVGGPQEIAAAVPDLVSMPPVELPHEAVVADAVADEVLLLALDLQTAASPWFRAMTAGQRRHSLDDLRWITRHAAAAFALDDPRVLDELLTWLDELLRRRRVPEHVLPDGARFLADALEAETPAVADLVRSAADRLPR